MHALGIYTYVYIHVYDQKETIYRIYIFQEIVQGYFICDNFMKSAADNITTSYFFKKYLK